MGACCDKNKNLSETQINENGTITKTYSQGGDIKFWTDLESLKFVKIFQIKKNTNPIKIVSNKIDSISKVISQAQRKLGL